jgi:hypothetical protein
MTRPVSRFLWRACTALALAALAPAAFAAISAAPPPAVPASMPDGLTSRIADDAANALWWGDFDRLEALYRSVRQSTELVDGGVSRLQWFRVGLSRVYGEDDATDPYFAQLEAMTRAWAVERPQSALAQLLYARALHARAYSFRGNDYADRVPPPAWKEFKRYIALEREQLDKNAALLKNESTADVYKMMAGRNDGFSFEEMHALALDTLARNPVDDGGFTELATSALPKWGGSRQQFEAVAREAARRVMPGAGMAMYAYLYDDNANGFEGELFEKSDVDWPTMRQGFRDWLARYPNAYFLNRFARDACHAQDRATTREVLDQIGDKPLNRAWGNQFESCRRWARGP